MTVKYAFQILRMVECTDSPGEARIFQRSMSMSLQGIGR